MFFGPIAIAVSFHSSLVTIVASALVGLGALAAAHVTTQVPILLSLYWLTASTWCGAAGGVLSEMLWKPLYAEGRRLPCRVRNMRRLRQTGPAASRSQWVRW